MYYVGYMSNLPKIQLAFVCCYLSYLDKCNAMTLQIERFKRLSVCMSLHDVYDTTGGRRRMIQSVQLKHPSQVTLLIWWNKPDWMLMSYGN